MWSPAVRPAGSCPSFRASPITSLPLISVSVRTAMFSVSSVPGRMVVAAKDCVTWLASDQGT